MKKQTCTKLIAIIITLALVAILLSQIEVADVVDTLTDIEPVYLLAGFGLYMLSYFFRALRFHILLNREVGIKELFNIVCVHNFINKMLPARGGELSYIYLLNKLHGRSTGEGIATLVIARIFDFITISLMFSISAMFIENLPDLIANVIWIMAGCMAAGGLTLVGFIYFNNEFMCAIKRFVTKTNIKRFSVVRYLLLKADETLDNLHKIKSNQIFIQMGTVSIGIWVSMYLLYSLLIYTFGINLSIFEVIVIVSFVSLLPLLPFYSIGGFGTTEVTITIVMISFGILKENAIVTSFGVHIIGIIFSFVAGLYGAWVLNIKNYRIFH